MPPDVFQTNIFSELILAPGSFGAGAVSAQSDFGAVSVDPSKIKTVLLVPRRKP